MYGSFFLFFFLQFFISLCCFFFFFVTVGFCFVLFFYKTLALKDSNTTQTTATNPHPWGPSWARGSGGPLGFFFCGCFPGVWHRWAGAGSWGGGICTAVPWGNGHKKGYLNKITTKSREPTKTRGGAHEGAQDNVEKRQMGPGWPWLSLEARWGWGRWALLSGYSNNTLLTGSTFRVLLP